MAILGMIEVWKAGKENGGKGKSDNDGEGNGSEFLKLLDAWMGDGDSGKGKLTLTVCTGSLFPGALGKLGGRRVTTHWRSLGTLKRLCEEVETGKSKTSLLFSSSIFPLSLSPLFLSATTTSY